MSSVWIVLCAPIGYCICFFLLGKRIRLFAELYDSISLPDVVAVRYKSETSRLLTALAILLGVLGYLGSQIMAMSQVLKGIIDSLLSKSAASDLSVASEGAPAGIPLPLCAVIACGVLVFYCVTGGIIASVYTDLMQGMVMLIAALLVFFTAVASVPGGIPAVVQTLAADDAESIGPWGTLGMVGCLSWFVVFALGMSGQPHVVSKLMMNRRIGDVKHILPLSIVGYTVAALLWISIGLAMRTLVLQGQHAPLLSADQAAHQFLQYYAHPVLSGVVIAGLFAAIMSTSDSFLNIGAAAIVHDIPRALIGRSLKRELLWARVATVVLAIASGVFAMFVGDLVALLGALGWGILLLPWFRLSPLDLTGNELRRWRQTYRWLPGYRSRWEPNCSTNCWTFVSRTVLTAVRLRCWFR